MPCLTYNLLFYISNNCLVRDQSLLCGGLEGGGVMGWARPIAFRQKGWAKREFHNGWGGVIVCFVKNHTHCNSCGRSK